MLRPSDLQVLAAWCRSRAMAWLPGRPRNGATSLLLEPAGRGLDAMLLVLGPKELRLLDAAGQELAAASDLQALLDAVDGGVADQSERACWRGRGAASVRSVRVAA